MTESTPILQIEAISKSYNKVQVLNVPHLNINRGDIIGLVGNNGAGKTTMLSLVLDLIKSSGGTILSKGNLVDKSEEWKQYTGAYLDENFLISFLTPEEYFIFIGKLHDWNERQTLQFLEKFESVFNGEILGRKKYIRDLSKGNQKKIGIVAAFIGDPELIILDEPFANLDPSTQIKIKNIILDNKDGKTFIVSSHDIHQLSEISTRIVLLEKGEVLRDVIKDERTTSELSEYFESRS
ncbi:MAG: ABC-2 type transport system ATP-binding protein [Saprospiraceae bacterium]|jgi:ABC-2 type transport system ATP-binding protein